MGTAVVLCNKRKLLRRLASWTSLLYWPPRMSTLWVVIFLHYILQRKWKIQHFGMWDLLILCWFGFTTPCREFGMIFFPNLWTCDAAWHTPHHLACETLTKALMPVNASLGTYIYLTIWNSAIYSASRTYVIWRSILTCIIDFVWQ